MAWYGAVFRPPPRQQPRRLWVKPTGGALTIEPGGIATAEAFGTAKLNLTAAPGGIASLEAFGTATIIHRLAPTGIASAEAFGAGQLNLTVAPTGVATAEAFGTAAISQGNQILPTGIASAEAFGTDQLNLAVAPSAITSGEAFGTALMRLGLAPTGIASAEAFGTAQLNLSLALTGIASAEAFGIPGLQGPSEDWNISVGSGYTDVSPKQLVRTSGNRLYIAASNCEAYPCEAAAQTIRMYKADTTGLPTGFTRMDSVDEPAGVAGWSIALDSAGVIHVAWTYRSVDGATLAGLRYTTFATSTDQWSATVETIDTTSPPDSIGQGVQTVALAVDSSDVPHLVYLRGAGTARRVYYRNRSGGSWSAATQLDSGVTYTGNERAWHPNLAFDTTGRVVAAWLRGSFNTDNDGTIWTRIRQTSGTWDTLVNVSGVAAARTTIDQSTSLLVTADNRYHLTFLQQPNDYIRYYYSDNAGASWAANNPGSGTQVTHNPSLGPAKGGLVRIYGHGTPDTPPDGHGENLLYFQGSGGAAAWGTWTQVVAGTNYDSSVNTRWSMFHWWYPNTLDIGYWNDAYPNNLYIGTDIEALDIQPAGIASAEAFGSGMLRLTLAPGGIASAEAFGTAGISQAGSIAPAGIASAEAFGGATVTAGAVISPTGIASLEAFGSASVGLLIRPGGIASAEAFGGPRMVLVINPSGIASLEAFGSATVTAAAIITPAGIASLEAFGVASLVSGLLDQPGHIEILIRRAGGIEVITRPLASIEIIVRREP